MTTATQCFLESLAKVLTQKTVKDWIVGTIEKPKKQRWVPHEPKRITK